MKADMTTPTEPTDELDAAAAAEHKTAVERGGKRWAWGIALVFIAVVAFIATRNVHTTPTGDELRKDATRACEQEFLPDYLRAPASAQYSSESVSVVGNVYTVTGNVDAQNAFGAMLRAPFTCAVQSVGDRWVLQMATVSGQNP